MNVEEIKSPAFLKDLNEEELYKLSDDIREFLLDAVSKTGGHLSSNLGVVELTIAIHKVFDSPNDQIFFDVGHQSYIHKILTGRAKYFDTLRQFNGLSGFIKHSESIHDLWESGHASTSLSGALGYSEALQYYGIKNKTIVVIGDGSIVGGMAFEALNHIGDIGENLLIILNDNEMSISKPVGGFAKTLAAVRTSNTYNHFKKFLNSILKKMPKGQNIYEYLNEKRNNFKNKLYEEGKLFTDLGLQYYGPINGHDYNDLLEILEFTKKLSKPTLVHVKTIKGKGYSFAENDDKGLYHGVEMFDKDLGLVKNNQVGVEKWSNIIMWALEDLAETNKDLVVLTPAMENGSSSKKFHEKYPDRFYDVGIAEEHATTMCAGLALGGMHPILTIYSTFLQRSYDQLLHDVCRMDTKVVIGVDRSGLVGADGETHQGIYDVAFLKTIPNLSICMPRNATEAQHLLNTCIKYHRPIAIRYPRGSAKYEKVNAYKEYDIGKWTTILDGSNKVIITYGEHVDQMCDYIKEHNYDIGLINARFIKPIDKMLLERLFNEYEYIYVYEEVVKNNNLYADIVIFKEAENYRSKLHSFCLPNEFIEHGDIDSLLKKYHLDYDTVFNKISQE